MIPNLFRLAQNIYLCEYIDRPSYHPALLSPVYNCVCSAVTEHGYFSLNATIFLFYVRFVVMTLSKKNMPSNSVALPVQSRNCYRCVIWSFNPNNIKSYKILQKLSPFHAAHGVAQSPYPIYRHGKACLSKQPPWRAAPDPRLACGRSRGSSPGPGGHAAHAFFLHLPFLPLSGDSFIRTFPTKPTKC